MGTGGRHHFGDSTETRPVEAPSELSAAPQTAEGNHDTDQPRPDDTAERRATQPPWWRMIDAGEHRQPALLELDAEGLEGIRQVCLQWLLASALA